MVTPELEDDVSVGPSGWELVESEHSRRVYRRVVTCVPRLAE